MNIEQLFEKRLVRNINGVVKAEQMDSDVVYTELDEFVVTRELKEHFRSFFDTYVAALDNPKADSSNKTGVWISGFFGSGKSHFLKILSYLLQNREVQQEGVTYKAIDFFKSKFNDQLAYQEVQRAVSRPTEVVLFNIDSRANLDDKDNAILKVFLKVFNDRVGYCADFPHVAHLERELDNKGYYSAFKTKFAELTGVSWEEQRDTYDFFRDEVAEALSASTGQSLDACKTWVDSLQDNFPLSVLNFAKWVNEYLSRSNDKNLLFMVDEVGQFIGKSSQMMLQLQTIVENLGVEAKGKAWVVVTAQADIDAAIGQLNRQQGEDFSRIQGRFLTRPKLSSSNTAEVIQKRLLAKTEPAAEALAKVFIDKKDILKNQLAFDTTVTMEAFKDDVTSFVDNYPFIPYQYTLVQKVFESIRTKGASGMHLAMGERSLLDAFQSAAKQIKDQAIGVLIPFDYFYKPIEGFLEPAVKRTIDQASQLDKLTQFDARLLRTLFLIRYVEAIKATVDNLVTLMIDQIDADRIQLKRQIKDSLVRLESELLIARNGDEYNFLTNEEKEIENEIRKTDIEPTAVSQKLSEIVFENILKNNRAYRYPVNKQEFKVSRFCNGHPKDGHTLEDLVVKLVSPIDVHYDNYQSETYALNASLENNGSVVMVLEDEKELWDDLQTLVKTDRYIKHANRDASNEHLLRDKSLENQERLKRLVVGIEDLLAQAQFYALGAKQPKTTAQVQSQLDKAYAYIIENSFAKLNLLRSYNGPDIQREINAVLMADDMAQLGLDLQADDYNPQATKELEMFIGLKAERSETVYVKTLIDYFGRRPYGWPENEVLLLLARYALAGKISFNYQSAPLNLKQSYEPLTNARKRAEIKVLKIRQHDEGMLQKATKLYKDAFNKTLVSAQEKDIAQAIQAQMQAWLESLKTFRSKSQAGQFPGKTQIEQGISLLAGLLGQPNSYALIEAFVQQSEKLLDLSEDFEDLDNFYTSQFHVWQELSLALGHYFKVNRIAIEKDPQAKQAMADLDAIYGLAEPYAKLNRIMPLIEQVKQVNQTLIQQKRQHAEKRVEERLARVQQQLDEVQANDALRNQCLQGLQQIKKHIQQSESIPEIASLQQEAADAEDKATDHINQHISKLQSQQKAAAQPNSGVKQTPTAEQPSQPQGKVAEPVAPPFVQVKPTHMLSISDYAPSGYIETEQDVDAYLKRIRQQMLDVLNAGERIRIK